MELTNKQKYALELAVARYILGEDYTCIAGYAGTGKSTVVKFIIEALRLNPNEVAYVSFTGKAAEVLRKKGCPNACTAHHLLYFSTRLPNGQFLFRPRPQLENPYKLIVVDEVSMLPAELWNLLLSHHIHVIALGDPGQLPPVNVDDNNHILDDPHIFLDEVMRQALDSEIIKLSMDIREGNKIDYFRGNDVQIIHPYEIQSGMYTWADIILCSTNKKRNEINNIVRKLINLEGGPVVSDKVISLTNHWDIFDTEGQANLVNGTIGTITYCYEDVLKYPFRTLPNEVPVLVSTFLSDTGEKFEGIVMDKKCILTGDIKSCTLSSQQEVSIQKSKSSKMPPLPLKFNYGYAITCHKAQGSEWDKVMVHEEWFPNDEEEHRRWLYTAVTRASNKLILVRSK